MFSITLSVPLQDFEMNNELKTKVIAFLEEVMHDPELLTQERKAAANIIRYRCVYTIGLRAHSLLCEASIYEDRLYCVFQVMNFFFTVCQDSNSGRSW